LVISTTYHNILPLQDYSKPWHSKGKTKFSLLKFT